MPQKTYMLLDASVSCIQNALQSVVSDSQFTCASMQKKKCKCASFPTSINIVYKFPDSGPIQQIYRNLEVGAIAARYLGSWTADKAVTKTAVTLATTVGGRTMRTHSCVTMVAGRQLLEALLEKGEERRNYQVCLQVFKSWQTSVEEDTCVAPLVLEHLEQREDRKKGRKYPLSIAKVLG